jgi:ribosomal protein S18 acetylase RimI-like enzyme
MSPPAPTLRQAHPTDAAAAGTLLYSTGAAAFQHIFGLGDEGRAQALLRAAFAQDEGAYSHRLATCAELSGGVAGLALGFPARRRSALDRCLLGLLLRRFSPLELLTVVGRGLRAARLTRGVPPDSYYLAHLAVDPARRRAGIGAGLLDAVLAQARSEGFPSCVLHVSVHNRPAISLYEGRGFTIIAEYRDPALERGAGIPGQFAMRCPLGEHATG